MRFNRYDRSPRNGRMRRMRHDCPRKNIAKDKTIPMKILWKTYAVELFYHVVGPDPAQVRTSANIV